jgi:hypothetical protein
MHPAFSMSARCVSSARSSSPKRSTAHASTMRNANRTAGRYASIESTGGAAAAGASAFSPAFEVASSTSATCSSGSAAPELGDASVPPRDGGGFFSGGTSFGFIVRGRGRRAVGGDRWRRRRGGCFLGERRARRAGLGLENARTLGARSLERDVEVSAGHVLNEPVSMHRPAAAPRAGAPRFRLLARRSVARRHANESSGSRCGVARRSRMSVAIVCQSCADG